MQVIVILERNVAIVQVLSIACVDGECEVQRPSLHHVIVLIVVFLDNLLGQLGLLLQPLPTSFLGLLVVLVRIRWESHCLRVQCITISTRVALHSNRQGSRTMTASLCSLRQNLIR